MNVKKNLWKIIHVKIIVITLIALLLMGCGRNVSVLKGETLEETSAKEDTIMEDTKEEQDIENQTINDEQEAKDRDVFIYVDLGGAVKNPGVYVLAQGSRVFQLIEEAGGFCENAYTKQINQADILEDGEQIYVYTIQEVEELLAQGTIPEISSSIGESDAKGYERGKINLNQATKADLLTLTGIGETRAEAILQYRSEHGRFKNIEELMQVDGIKQKTYEKIKDCITVQ